MDLINLQPGMELMNKDDEWKFIELMIQGTRNMDLVSGFVTHEIGTKIVKFYTLDELIADWEPVHM